MRVNDGSNYGYPEQRWVRMLVSYKLNPTKGLTNLTYFSTFRRVSLRLPWETSFDRKQNFPYQS